MNDRAFQGCQWVEGGFPRTGSSKVVTNGLHLANWAILSEKSGFRGFPSLTGNMGWENQNLPVKKFFTLGANPGFLCGMLRLAAVRSPPRPGKFLNLSRCEWIPTGMVTPGPGRCSFGVLGVLTYPDTLSPLLRDSQSPECSDRGPGLGPWERTGSGGKMENRPCSALFLTNPLFILFPVFHLFFLSLFQPVFTVFHSFSPYYIFFFCLFHLYSL